MAKVGVAECPRCKEPVPVIERTVDIEVNEKLNSYHVVACAICYSILNYNKDIEITYYDHEQIKYVTRWDTSDELRSDQPEGD